MKTIITIMLAMLTIGGAMAQEKGKRDGRKGAMKDLTIEQKAELMTKKMTLHLDLNESQQSKVKAIQMKQLKEMEAKRDARKAQKDSDEKMNSEERYSKANAKLDAQIAHKEEMKNILDAEQYEKWEKTMGKRHHKRRGERGERRGKKSMRQ